MSKHSGSDFISKLSQFLIDQVPGLIIVYNLKTKNFIFVNESVRSILGYRPKDFLDKGFEFGYSLVHPEDLERVMIENKKALELANQGQEIPIVNFEYRMRHKKGHWIWLHTDGKVFARNANGKVESIINISVDISKRKNKEIAVTKDLVESELRYKNFLSQSAQGIWRIELEKPVPVNLTPRQQINQYFKYAYLAECNLTMAKMYGFKKAEDLKGARLSDLLPKNDPNNIAYLKAFIGSNYDLHDAISYEIDKDGYPKIFQNNLFGIIENGKMVRAWGIQTDVTQEKKIKERLELLELINKKLMISLDHKIVVREITKLIVPHFADYCRIVILDDAGKIAEIEVNHIQPNKIKYIRKLYELYKNNSPKTYGIPTLLLKGEPELISHVDEAFIAKNHVPLEIIQLINKIGLKSYMGIPLVARGSVLGAITFSSIHEKKIYTDDDLQFAKILASRIALIIDNYNLYQKAQKSIDIRDNFISIASHELKTPLTSLKLYAQILQKHFKSNQSGNVTNAISKIDAQINKLTYLLGDLLDITKIQAGRMEYKFEPFDLSKRTKEIINNFLPIEGNHKIVLQADQSVKVHADRNRIEQVIVNFISNAIKYSPNANKIIVKIKQTGDYAHVSVRDFGIGIDKTYINKIFDKFFRVNSHDEGSFPGMGIGLFISKQIIQKHGGTIKVVSKKGVGSTFSFTLPISLSKKK